MNNTREMVLTHLLKHPRSTINDLADAIGINPISVRHHIGKLEAEGQVNSTEERHGVGRPRRVYTLTEGGMELFPQRYLSLSKRLMEQIKETLPPEMVTRLFEDLASDAAGEYINQRGWSKLDFEERVEVARQMMVAEGFTVEVRRENERVEIRETSCPYVHVGHEHPEVCIVDEKMLELILAVDVSKTHCVLHGDEYCAYVTPAIQPADIHLME
jgi:predicted ArsR family transcriptional regulator